MKRDLKRDLPKLALICAVTLGVALGAVRYVSALHRFTPVFVQGTSQAGGTVGRGDAWVPDRIAFESNGDVLGNGNNTWQIFMFDLGERDMAGLPGLTQITYGSFNARYPSISMNFEIDVSRAYISFEADGDLCADPSNNCDALASPVSGRQVFMYSLTTRQIRQVTKGPGDCLNPDVSGFANKIVFDSTTDLLGSGVIATVPELYMGDLDAIGASCPQLPCPPGKDRFGKPLPRGLEQVTIGGGWHGSVSYNGKALAFESRGDLANGGVNPGVQHIYVIRKGVITQVSTGYEDARLPTINSLGGRYVAYEQNKPVGGGSSVPHVIVVKASRGGAKIRFSVPGFQPSLDAKGARVAFTSSVDLLENGSQGNQVFTQNLRRRRSNKGLTQITQPPVTAGAAISTPFQLLAFVSSDDLTGAGNTTPQLFVSNFYKLAPSDFVTPYATPTPIETATPGGP